MSLSQPMPLYLCISVTSPGNYHREAHTKDMQAQHSNMQAQRSNMQCNNSNMQAQHSNMQVQHSNMQAQHSNMHAQRSNSKHNTATSKHSTATCKRSTATCKHSAATTSTAQQCTVLHTTSQPDSLAKSRRRHKSCYSTLPQITQQRLNLAVDVYPQNQSSIYR